MNLDHVFCLKYERQVGTDHVINFETDRYRVVDLRFGSLRKKQVIMHCRESGEVEVFYGYLKVKVEKNKDTFKAVDHATILKI